MWSPGTHNAAVGFLRKIFEGPYEFFPVFTLVEPVKYEKGYSKSSKENLDDGLNFPLSGCALTTAHILHHESR